MLMLPTHFVLDVCQYDRFRNIEYQSRYHNHEAPFLQKNMEQEVLWLVEPHTHLPESSFQVILIRMHNNYSDILVYK